MNFLGAHDIIDLISKYLCLAGVLAQIPICLFFPPSFLLHSGFPFLKIIADNTFFVYFIYIYIPCIMYRAYGGLHGILCP